MWGEECGGAFVGFALGCGEKVIKCGDEDAGYVGGFVVYDGILER